MKHTLFTPFSVITTLILLTQSANADDSNNNKTTRKEEPTKVDDDGSGSGSGDHLRGLEITLRPELGSVGGASPVQAVGQGASSTEVPAPLRPNANAYGTSLGAGLQLGYRFHPLISAGLRGNLGTVGANPSNEVRDASRSWQSAGIYARVYPLALNESARRYIDPWLATGITYVHDQQAFTQPSGTGSGGSRNIDVAWQVDSHAVGIPIGVGVDYRVTKWLSAGPSFEYVIMNPIAGCLKATAPGMEPARICTDEPNPKQGIASVASGAWNAGLALRVTPF